MGRGIGPSRRLRAALVGVLLLAVGAQAGDPPPSHAQAVVRFRAAAALQARALYDLAAAEYQSLVKEFPSGTLIHRARLQRGICLFQLGQFADARTELRGLIERREVLRTFETEQLYAYLGLSEYNLSLTAAGAERDKQLDAAIDALEKQLAQFPDGTLAPQTSFYRAEALYARGRLDAAVAAYRSLLAKYPKHPQRADTLYALAVAEQERHDFGDAVETYALFEREFPQHAALADARSRHGDALLSHAESQLAAGQTLAARRTVKQLLAAFPESALVPPALAVMAQVQLGESELVAAETSLDECLQRSTQPEVTNDARMLRAKVRYDRGNLSGSLADASDVLAHDPQRTEALHLRGLCEAGLGKPADAVKTFTQIIVSDPDCPTIDRVLYDLAWAQQAANQPEEATATFAKLADSHPESQFAADCHFRVGEAKYAAKDFAAAAKCYFQACDSAPNPELFDKSLHKLAWSCFERRQFGAAQEAFERQIAVMQERVTATGGTVDPAATLEPLAADAMLMIVECRFQQQQYGLALESFDVAFEQRAASESLRAMACVHAAQSAAQMKNWQRAFELADLALRDFPASRWADEARCERGIALVELGRLDDAQRDLVTVAAEHKDLLQVKSELALGKIHVAKKDYDAAVRMFFKVAYGHGGTAAPASFHPWQAEAIFAAARVLEESGRQDSARKLYQELVDSYPASERTALARESLEGNLRR